MGNDGGGRMSTQRVIHGATAQYIQSLLQQVGQAPTLETGSDGTPVLRSATGGCRCSARAR